MVKACPSSVLDVEIYVTRRTQGRAIVCVFTLFGLIGVTLKVVGVQPIC